MTVEEIIARAVCNRRMPKPVHSATFSGDAYDNLSGWAKKDASADSELREFDLDGEAVVVALDAAGYNIVPPKHVPMPVDADEAAMMILLGESWLRSNAPERLRK